MAIGCQRLTELLRESAGDTLEALDFDILCDECNKANPDALQSFKQLRTVALGSHLLSHENKENLNFVSLLPPIIEELRFTSTFPPKSDHNSISPFENRPLCSLITLPNLQKITLEVHLLSKGHGNQLNPEELLPNSIEELEITPSPTQLGSRWEEQELLLSYPKLLRESRPKPIKTVTVCFNISNFHQHQSLTTTRLERSVERFQTHSVRTREINAMYASIEKRLLLLNLHSTSVLDMSVVIQHDESEHLKMQK